jgi:transcriptional regulator with XRE-family HTH domain
MQNSFGPALRSMRGDLGISQLDLAQAIQTTQRHVSFLETGRSAPTRDFVIRLAVGLTLSLPQRAALFDAAGYQNPYMKRQFGPEAHKSVLDMLERRVLAHWPYPHSFWTKCGTSCG